MLQNRKGFTLTELLIVVAIIATLTSIVVYHYVTSLEKARESAELSDIHAAFEEVLTEYVLEGSVITRTVKVQQNIDGWQSDEDPALEVMGGNVSPCSIPCKTEGEYSVTIEVNAETGDIIPIVS